MTKQTNTVLDLIAQTDSFLGRPVVETARGEWREFLEACEEEGFRVARDCGDVTISKYDDRGVRCAGIRCIGGHTGPMVDGVTSLPVAFVEDRVLSAAIHLGLEG